MGQQPGRFDSTGVVHQLRANALKCSDRPTELPAHEGVIARQLLDADAVVNGGQGRTSISLQELDAHQAQRGEFRREFR